MSVSPKFVAALICTVLLTLAVVFGAQHYNALKAKAALADSRGTTLTTATGMVNDGTAADAKKATVDTGVGQARSQFQQSTREAKQNEPTVASRADAPVPVSVRNAYRARRLARERLGHSEGERASPAESASPPER